MLAIATGQEIDFTSVKAEPFSNVIHFKVPGRIRSMRVSDWGHPVEVLRHSLDSDFYGSDTVTAQYVVGVLVNRSADGWADVMSIVHTDKPMPIPVVNVFTEAPRRAGGYGRSWVGRADMDTAKFVQDILNSLR